MAEPTEADANAAAILCGEEPRDRCAAIAQALADARADGAAARDKEWAEAFHRGDWFEDEPDMTLEAFRAHGDNRRGSFNEVSRISYEQGVKDGLEQAAGPAKTVAPYPGHIPQAVRDWAEVFSPRMQQSEAASRISHEAGVKEGLERAAEFCDTCLAAAFGPDVVNVDALSDAIRALKAKP